MTRSTTWFLACGAALCTASLASAQAPMASRPVRPTGRVSFYTDVSRTSPVGAAPASSADFITNVTYALQDAEGNGLEYGLDLRHARYSHSSRTDRVSLYDGYVGGRFAGGRVRVRAGQMWLTDLGGLGSVTGAVFEYKAPLNTSPLGRLRVGGFGGMEPMPYQLGAVPGIRKVGGYGILEGDGGRRHVLGYVRLADRNLVERSVVTTTNFVPIHSRVFFYQAAEYDLVGPAGQGTGGLTYLMVNAHASAGNHLDLQGLYHRGRSIDTRSIAEDVLAGRPLRDGALDALLYASAGARATVRITREVRINVGYTRDQNNRDSADTKRVSLGVSAGNVGRSGVDVTVNESRIRRPTGEYDSLYASVGRQFGRIVYLSGDYSNSVSIVRFTRSDGITVETRPQTRQLSLSSVVNVSRHVSLSITADRTKDADVSDARVLAGMTYRFR
jgi:hypothetical protein